ncbi:diacylglycerol/lipid kinase family protein [Kribbella qitaiheensis]|uniref:diacylglycerol/lipid kinase family protein n=1 Tax=Kribbella qitaiheensis TaxID=1544730 RepID=UPI0036192450
MVRTRWGLPVATGSMAVVAAAAAAHGLPFVCVPAGTRNHFALDLGVDPHDVLGALEAFAGGIERLIDVADVNGRLFLNNVSLGIYGDAVRSPGYRDAKMRTLLETAEKVLGPRAEVPALRLVDDMGREHQHLAVVLVSNNPYTLDRPVPVRPSTAADSGSSFSTHPALPRTPRGLPPTLQGERGAHHVWTSARCHRYTQGLMARRSI